MKKLSILLLPLFLAFVTIISCDKDEDKGNKAIKAVNNAIYELMQEVYLWYDNLPTLDPEVYATPNELMDEIRYKMYDKWSTVITKTEYNQYFEQGELIGHGFLLSVDNNNNIRVAFVYRSTQTYELGVRRSWIITRVNGSVATTTNIFDLLGPAKAGHTNNITFLNDKGESVDLRLTKEIIAITPVLHYEVLDQENSRIGYMVFQDFIDTAKAELDEVFQDFTSAGIEELIVDMRYNGGGSVDVAEYLSGWLIGKNNGGNPLSASVIAIKCFTWIPPFRFPPMPAVFPLTAYSLLEPVPLLRPVN